MNEEKPGKFTLIIKPNAEKSLRSLERKVQVRIVNKLRQIVVNPYSADSLKLVGGDGQRRVRVGDFRIIYSVEDQLLIVTVVKLGHRREIYDR